MNGAHGVKECLIGSTLNHGMAVAHMEHDETDRGPHGGMGDFPA